MRFISELYPIHFYFYNWINLQIRWRLFIHNINNFWYEYLILQQTIMSSLKLKYNENKIKKYSLKLYYITCPLYIQSLPTLEYLKISGSSSCPSFLIENLFNFHLFFLIFYNIRTAVYILRQKSYSILFT